MRRTAFLDEEELAGVNDELVPGSDDTAGKFISSQVQKPRSRDSPII